MEALADQLKAKPNANKKAEAAYLQAYNRIFNTMITKMESIKPTGNINRDFLNRMIPHLEAGIQMGKTIIKYTKNPELKAIAQNMITTQQKQVADINKLLKTVQ